MVNKVEALKGLTTRRASKRRESLLLQGDVSQQGYIVESGCLRLWYNNDGQDITIQFFLAGGFVASLDSFLKQRPSRFGIEAIGPTVIRSISRDAFLGKLEETPGLRDVMFDAVVERMADYQDLFLSRIMQTPEQRYRHLVETTPELLDIVPHHYIASFLGVTPVTLSRIRTKIKAG